MSGIEKFHCNKYSQSKEVTLRQNRCYYKDKVIDDVKVLAISHAAGNIIST